jgi:formamidopyrimidine-DNA glycosylase
MPELPDIDAYLGALERRIMNQPLSAVRLQSPFLLRTVAPRPADAIGKNVCALARVGKRICIGFDGDLWFVIHLMIAGRLHWNDVPGAAIQGGKRGLAAFDFASGTLMLTEAGTKKRAALHVFAGTDVPAAIDPGGLEILHAKPAAFKERLRSANHTLKRALTDPHLFSGIGNAYSDEILHRARLSPVAMTRKLDDAEIARLHAAAVDTLELWRAKLAAEAAEDFPEKVTAFRDDMAVHGKYGKPCPACGTAVQRIRHATNETNYCPRCQTSGRLLADRALSRLLKKDWPRTVDELERLRLPPG